MASRDLWIEIDSSLGEIFMMIPEKAFSDFSVMTVTDLIQLRTVKEKLIFFKFSNKGSMIYLLGWQLWHLFEYTELTEVLRQNDKLFFDLLNKLRVGNINDNVENLPKAIFTCDSDKNYPKMPYTCYI